MYCLILERLERQVLTEQQVAATLMAAGAEGVEFPTFSQRQEELDALLDERQDVRVVDPEQADLLRALGLQP